MTASRRAVLALPLLAIGCADRPEPTTALPLAPLSYRHLTPLPLNVAALDIREGEPPPLPGDLGNTLGTRPAEAVRIMARDRLLTVGGGGAAVFTVTGASLVLVRGGLACLLGCRLEVQGADGAGGVVEAQARGTFSGSGNAAARDRAAEGLLRRTMDDLNVEFEFQLRRNLRDWLQEASPGMPSGPAPVEREELPRG